MDNLVHVVSQLRSMQKCLAFTMVCKLLGSKESKYIRESDSQLAIDLILGTANHFHLYSSLIMKIKQFQRVFREGNKIVDWLAKEDSTSQDNLTILNQCPSSFYVIYLADIMRHSSLRS